MAAWGPNGIPMSEHIGCGFTGFVGPEPLPRLDHTDFFAGRDGWWGFQPPNRERNALSDPCWFAVMRLLAPEPMIVPKPEPVRVSLKPKITDTSIDFYTPPDLWTRIGKRARFSEDP